MKKLIIASILAMSFFSANAQVDVTANPIGFLWGNFDVSADFPVSDKISVGISSGVGVGGGLFSSLTEVKRLTVPVILNGKFYFTGDERIEGMYATGWVRNINRSYKYDNEISGIDYKATKVGLGLGIGFKLVTDKGFVFDVGAGIGRNFYEKYTHEVFELTPKVIFAGNLSFGYRFGTAKA